jgi:predicted extracellular nuclease
VKPATGYTHIHNGHFESLDHVLVSQEFVGQNPRHVGAVEYVSVLNDHLIDETLSDDKIPRWQSDHGQVVVTIKLRHRPGPLDAGVAEPLGQDEDEPAWPPNV